MLQVSFSQANLTFTRPDSMTDDECADIQAFHGQIESHPVIITKWQPNREDIEAINRGEGIYLLIYNNGMPPVSLTTENPFN